MKFCYLCHDEIKIGAEGVLSYSTSIDTAAILYACPYCVKRYGVDNTFEMLEDHYEDRNSMPITLSYIDSRELRRMVDKPEDPSSPS